eukprot:TRINITY_DN4331_c0_g2_i5.p1 TRINITY_DN4331_c0_g2~~TRINITY_DN4331_c0_g2_i5.p1  ORF type:complete len:270 (+),score=60.61 TRINITY_DN4331_c0_g2_i5:41-811(+)
MENFGLFIEPAPEFVRADSCTWQCEGLAADFPLKADLSLARPAAIQTFTEASSLEQEELHAQSKCTPCKFYKSASGCAKGQDCKFCHLPHQKRVRARPNKAIRDQCKRIKDMLVHKMQSEGREAAIRATASLDMNDNKYLIKLLNNSPIAQNEHMMPEAEDMTLCDEMIRGSSKSSAVSTMASAETPDELSSSESTDASEGYIFRPPPGLEHVSPDFNAKRMHQGMLLSPVAPGQQLVRSPWPVQQEFLPGMQLHL